MTTEMAAAVPLDAFVVFASGGRFAISGGSEAGIRESAEFELILQGEAIKGSSTVKSSVTTAKPSAASGSRRSNQSWRGSNCYARSATPGRPMPHPIQAK